MAKGKNEAASVDIFIEEVLSEDPAKSTAGAGKKTSIKSVLKIPYTPNKTNKALRVFTKNNDQKFYASVRIGTLQQTEEGYECNVTGNEADLLGNRFELTEIGTKEIVMRGKISNPPKAGEASKKAEATSTSSSASSEQRLSAGTVVDFQKTGTGK